MPEYSEQTEASSVAEIVAALNRLVESDVRTVHDCTSLVVGSELGPTTHFIIGIEEWAALTKAIRTAEAREALDS